MTGPSPRSAADDVDEPSVELALPTFTVLARFADLAGTAEEAQDHVRSRLAATRGLYDDVAVERREPDGTWLLEARFVVVSVDAGTAVLGVDETLAAAGLTPDEVWAVLPDPG